MENNKKSVFKSEKFKRGGLATVFTVVFIAIIIVLNVVFSVLTDRYPSMNIDLTKEKLNTLSENALTVVDNLDKKIEIFIIGDEDAIRGDEIFASYGVKYSQVANLTDKIREANPSKVTVKYIDPDKDPTFISTYADDALTSGKVLIRSEDRYRVLTVADLFSITQNSTTGAMEYYSMVDGALANAIYLVNLDNVPVIAVAGGHDEVLSATYRSSLDALFDENCFEVKEFNMLTEEIPEDASVVLLLAPTKDYTPDEIAKLQEYIKEGDRTVSHTIFVSTYFTQAELPNLAGFLEDWGLKQSIGTVIAETDDTKHLSNSDAFVFVDVVDGELSGVLNSKAYSNVLACNAGPVQTLFEVNNQITTYPLLTTAKSAYAVTESTEDTDNPDTESFTTAALAQRATALKDGSIVRSNVVLYGESDSFYYFMNNTTFGNRQYILDLFKYLTGTTDTGTGLTVNQTQTSVMDITASSAVVVILGLFIFTIGLPLVILVWGLVVFFKRRHL